MHEFEQAPGGGLGGFGGGSGEGGGEGEAGGEGGEGVHRAMVRR